MRIAMMCDSYYPTRDGVVTSITTISKSLEELGHKVWIVAPDPGVDKRIDNPNVLWLKSVRLKTYDGYYVPIQPSADLERMRSFDFDVIHIHGMAVMAVRGLVLAHYLNIPVVMTFHTMIDDVASHYLPIKLPEKTLKSLIWIYLRNIMKRMDAVIVPTDVIGKEILSHSVNMRLLRTIPTGIDTNIFHPELDGTEFSKKYGLKDGKKIVHVGRMSFEKEIDMAIRTMAYVDATLILAGAGPHKKELEQLTQTLKLTDKVKFLGFIPDEDLPYAYACADMAISCSAFETQGMSILEAMASRLPCACRNARAFTSIIKDGENGFFFNDHEECVKAIEKCLVASESVKEASYVTAISNSVELSAKKTVDLYEEVIAAKKKRLEAKDCST